MGGGRRHPLTPTSRRSKLCSLGFHASEFPRLLMWMGAEGVGSRCLSPQQQQRPLGIFVVVGGDAALQSWSREVTHGERRGCPGAWSGSWEGMVYNTPAPRNC